MMKDEEQIPELKEWGLHLPDDPHFHSSVWREIAMRDATSPANRVREFFERLFTPGFAIPAASAAILAVMLSASLHGLRSREKTWESLSLSYNSAIDPISHTEAISFSRSKH
ncbi:hypothetical protein VSU19_15190 [Verrucomicrobiales bacterium BCK34]|nr:hypothetical protein [Verrucomicrobiales bacterium BCK34]